MGQHLVINHCSLLEACTLDVFQLNDAASSSDYNKCIENDAVYDMCQQLCSLTLSSNLLSSMGLDAHKTDLKIL